MHVPTFCRWIMLLASTAIAMAGAPAAASDNASPVLTGVVTKVIDADTIDVKLASGNIRVRLYGIDAPEKAQPWGKESTAFLADKVLNQQVDLEPFEQDRYDRLTAIVHSGDVNVNAELVRLGHAWAYRQYMKKKDAALCANEAEARLAKRGLWSLPRDERIAPWEYRKRKSLDVFTDYTITTTAQCTLAIGKR